MSFGEVKAELEEYCKTVERDFYYTEEQETEKRRMLERFQKRELTAKETNPEDDEEEKEGSGNYRNNEGKSRKKLKLKAAFNFNFFRILCSYCFL